ncbi:MAG TPA: ABC transporter permease [Blastocatellia bacterium]|nr:ABC transporter permease [Blastocatellia bacterium]
MRFEHWFYTLPLRLRSLFRRAQVERELDEELQYHLERQIEERIAKGMTAEEAHYAALRAMGGVERRKEESRDMRHVRLIEELMQDLRYGLRTLRKSPGFTAVAALSLAFGIGANTAIFSLINALMLRPLPVKNAQELALFSITGPSGTGHGFDYTTYETFRDGNQSFTGVIAADRGWRGRLLVNEPGAGVESVQEQRVSGNFFSVLGVNAVVGRTLIEADDNPSNPQPGAVISYEYWRRRFGLDPQVVGQRVTVNDTALTIVGVAPPSFFGLEVGNRPELWWPAKADISSLKGWGWLRVIGRLRPGVSIAQAQAEMETIFQRLLNDEAARSPNWTPTERRKHFEEHVSLEAGSAGHTDLRQMFRQPLFILMVAVGLTLLIACVNVANLLLARAATKRKEIAVRLALGAGRFRLLRQLLTENVLLSLLGGAAGLLFARVFLRGLITYLPQQAHKTTLDVSPDARVLAFTLLVSILTGLLFGLAPTWQATRIHLTASLKDQSGASAGQSWLTLNKALVVAQVALSLFLLIGAGLFARSLRNLLTLDAGLNYENVVQFRLDTSGDYGAERLSDLYKRMLARLESLPGAQSATLSNYSLLEGAIVRTGVSIPGYTPPPDKNMSSMTITVGPRFFETMKMPILAGRDFGPQDEPPLAPPKNASAATGPKSPAEAPPLSAVVNQAMARYFFGNENPVGKRFVGSGQMIEIIGVTRDSKHVNLREQPQPVFYLYFFQHPGQDIATFQLRVSGQTVDYTAMIERLARELDPQAPAVGLRMMRDWVDDSLTQERFIAQLGSAFSLFALLLACVGLYGVMSYTVARRTNEIGIRMALGAQRSDVVGLVLRETMLLVVIGVIIGLSAALGATRLVASLLYGLTPNDPLTIALASMLLLTVAALAGYLPARRASRVDPMVALRHD